MQLRCPNCQGVLKEGASLSQCPNCGADLTKLLTPIETGIMTNTGLALLAGAAGFFIAIALLAHVKEFRSPIFVIVIVSGSSLSAWARAKSLTARERLAWERFWIVIFCAGIGAFWTVLMGLNWVWAITVACIGAIIGYLLCRYSESQWQRERKR